MADPLTIVGGVLGILSSLTSLSVKINDLRQDVQGARTEIRELAEETEDLALVLGHLKVAKEQGIIAYSLEKDLGTVLHRLGQTVSETETFLQRCGEKKRTSGVYWAFTGKSQCLQLCRRLESYKSTLNVTMTISSVLQGHENHGQVDRVLNSISHIRQQLSDSRNDYVLERYLMEMETVYEGSTVANFRSMSEEKTESRAPSPESIDAAVPAVSKTSTPSSSPPPIPPPAREEPGASSQTSPTFVSTTPPSQSPPKDRAPASLDTPTAPPSTEIPSEALMPGTPVEAGNENMPGRPNPSTSSHHPGSTANATRTADHWKQPKAEASHVHEIHLPEPQWPALAKTRPDRLGYDIALASREGCFAIGVRGDNRGKVDVLVRGIINQPNSHTIHSFPSKLYEEYGRYPPFGSVKHYPTLLDLAVRGDGAVIVAFGAWHQPLYESRLFLRIWRSITSLDSEPFSAPLPHRRPKNGIESPAVFSPDSRRIAVCEDDNAIAIREVIDIESDLVCRISINGCYSGLSIVWTPDSNRLLVTLEPRKDSTKPPAIAIFSAITGSCIASAGFRALYDYSALSYLDSQHVTILNHFRAQEKKNSTKSTMEGTSRPSSEKTKALHFISRLDMKAQELQTWMIKHDRVYRPLDGARFSPDGSCFLVQEYNRSELEEADVEPPVNGPLILYDSLSRQAISRIPYQNSYPGRRIHCGFDHGGQQIMVARSTAENTLELSFWEPASTQA